MDVGVSLVAPSRFAREGDWAQSDDVFNYAPRDADVLLAMDADVLPVGPLEETVDVVAHGATLSEFFLASPVVGAWLSGRFST